MDALFARVLDMSLTGSLVILAVLAVRLMLSRAPRRISYLLWSVVLFRLLCPVSISVPGAPIGIAVQTVETAQVTTQIGRTSTITYLAAAVPEASNLSFRELLPWIWLAGVTFLLLRTAIQFFRLRRQLVGAVLLKNSVYLSDHIPGPFVLGLWKPRIYLPSHTPREEYQYIISHERCHIHRGDHIVKLLAYCALCLHWFNPLVWLAFTLAGQDMEMSCDETVVQIIGPQVRPAYAQALVHQASGKTPFAATPLSFGAGDIKGRVRHMARWRQPRFWITALAVIVCAAALIAFALNPQQTQADAQYPGIALSLPEGITLNGEDGSIADGTGTIGGIRRYKSKDGDFDVNVPMKCFTDMGLPQLTDGIQRDYMIEGSANADWMASFYHPDEGETIHQFFFQGDTITEVWFHRDKIHPDVMQAILESITFGETTDAIISVPAKATLTEEAYDLYKCRAVLEELQSHDAYKVHTLKEDMKTLTCVSDSTYWRSGDRWMRSEAAPSGPVWSKNGNGEDSIPWLFRYQWDEQEVVHVSSTPTEEGKRVDLLIQAPYDGQSDDAYYAAFSFDPQGAFQNVTISAFYLDSENFFTDRYNYTIQILSLDEDIINQELDAQ